MMLVPTKSIWKSKTFWFGVLQILIGVVELIQTEVLLSDGGGWAAVISGIVVIALRYVTKQPVTATGSTDARHVDDKAT